MKPLRIGIVADLFTALPPKRYGGIERVVYCVSEALHARGHDVTIFGPDETATSCRSIPFGPVLGEECPARSRHILKLWKLLNRHARKLDVVHDFFRAAYLLPILPRNVLKLISYACPISSRNIRALNLVGGESIHYAVCGQHMFDGLDPALPRSKFHVVYNPIDLAPYTFQAKPNAKSPYLVFFSRLMIAKGAHVAIEIARRTQRRLIIAGNVQPSDQAYFDQRIKPHIDGKLVQFVGSVDDRQKNDLLGNADAMLFPISWEEPFGLVVGEAMACGTPVLAFRRGAMPELITDGINGYLSTTADEMVRDVDRISLISRAACRRTVTERFAPDIIAGEYEKLYHRLLKPTRSR